MVGGRAKGSGKARRLILFECLPHRGGALTKSLLGDQFARPCRENIIVLFSSREPVMGKLAFECQRNKHLLAHEPKTPLLGGIGVAHVANADGLLLPNAPAAPACLTEHVRGVAGFIEQDRCHLEQI